MTEQGPFRPTATGPLVENPYSWNKLANVIFIEQPAGVGFSFSDSKMENYTDAQTANDNHLFIKGWFEKFPQYAKNDFYLTSESYGGHYLPTLTKSIVDAADIPNFKGFAVGNPLTYMEYRNFGAGQTCSARRLHPFSLLPHMYQDNTPLMLGTSCSQHRCSTSTKNTNAVTRCDSFCCGLTLCRSCICCVLACFWVHVCVLKLKFIGNGIAPYHAQVENVTDECNAVMGQMDNLTSLIDPFVPCGCVWHCGLSVAVTRAVFLLVTRWTFLFALRTAVTRRLLPAETNGTRC